LPEAVPADEDDDAAPDFADDEARLDPERSLPKLCDATSSGMDEEETSLPRASGGGGGGATAAAAAVGDGRVLPSASLAKLSE
jgi:hypothetical protein